MARKYTQGSYQIKNPDKYIGTLPCYYRSSWELAFMRFLDNHPSVTQWASESIHIPYINPFTRKSSIYVPDFLVMYTSKSGKQHGEVVEIKPIKEAVFENSKSVRDRAALELNKAKWAAATAWCKTRGLVFRVVTERDLFVQKR